MATFDILFKSWSTQVTEHIKEIKDDMKTAEEAISKSKSECQKKVEDLDIKYQKLREEFIIHKTTINAKTTLISGIIAFIVLVTSLLINIGRIKDDMQEHKAPVQIETNKIPSA